MCSGLIVGRSTLEIAGRNTVADGQAARQAAGVGVAEVGTGKVASVATGAGGVGGCGSGGSGGTAARAGVAQVADNAASSSALTGRIRMRHKTEGRGVPAWHRQ